MNLGRRYNPNVPTLVNPILAALTDGDRVGISSDRIAAAVAVSDASESDLVSLALSTINFGPVDTLVALLCAMLLVLKRPTNE